MALLVTAVLFWLFSSSDPAHRVTGGASLKAQFAMLRTRACGATASTTRWCSAAVALALWMTKYYIGEYGFDMKRCCGLLRCPGGVLRAVGG